MNFLKDRFTRIADYYGISVRKLEAKCDLQRGNLSNTTGAIGSDRLAKIFDNCPEIDLVWLVTGRGEMLRAPSSATPINDNKELLDRIQQLAIENHELKKQLAEVKAQKKARSIHEPYGMVAEQELKYPKNK